MISYNIDNIYEKLARKLLTAGNVNGTTELTNVQFTLTNLDNNIVSIRGISPSYLCGELLWYFMGMNNLEFIARFSKFWTHISDDGKTSNSAYGYIMANKFGFNQVEKVIEQLTADPFSRRAVINLNTPNEHMIETKDEPCTIALQFMIRDGRLDCTAIMRSNDIWFGTPYDVAFFTELQKYIAKRLGVKYGWYTHFATSLHAYGRDLDKLQSMLERVESHPIHIDIEMLDDYKEIVIDALEEHRDDDQKELVVNLCQDYNILRMEEDANASNM